jgi:hypothetical protein
MSFDMRGAQVGKHVGYDYEKITVADTAIGLTSAKLTTSPQPKRVYITAETAPVRYRYDGTDPTDTEGHLLTPNSYLVITGIHNLKNFRAIRTTATSGIFRVSYER